MHNSFITLLLGSSLTKSDFWKQILKRLPYLPVYNVHFFLTNFASKIEMRIIHGTFCFHEVICITSQKVQSRSTPNFMQPAEINQDKKFVYMQLCTLLQWHIHQSCNLFTITIENLLHFLEYFDDKANSMKDFPLGFVKVQSTHLSFGFLNKCGKI